jgi:hypothetical protein
MAILTERGRWSSSTLDESGKYVFGNLSEQGHAVFGIDSVTGTLGSVSCSTNQIIFTNAFFIIPIKLDIYINGTISYATTQTIFDSEKQIVGRIEFKGSRELYLYLNGSRELIANLKGGLPVAEKNQNISMYASESKIVGFTAKDNNTGLPIDLSGATIKWAMRNSNHKTNDLYKDLASGIGVTDAAAGKFTVTFNPIDTATLSGDFIHQAEVVDASGKESIITEGKVTVSKNIFN